MAMVLMVIKFQTLLKLIYPNFLPKLFGHKLVCMGLTKSNHFYLLWLLMLEARLEISVEKL